MPLQLLPASAAAFAPRSAPNIVLNRKVEPWLTQTLKRINKIKRPLNNVPQHLRCLTETLGGPSAIWTLASLMVPKLPDTELRKDSNPLIEALFNYQLIHLEAYVVHVDMVSQHEVAFKLTPETIETLVDYHREVYSPDTFNEIPWSWPEKDAQLKKLQEEFVQAINKYVFRTDVKALEGLEEDGAGELLDGKSDQVKSSVGNLFIPLLPPPPRIVDIIHPPPTLLPNTAVQNTVQGNWWVPPPQQQPQQSLAPPSIPVESWKVLPSTPSPTATSCSDNQSSAFWPQDINLSSLGAVQLPSPTPSFSQPSTTYTSAPAQFFSSPQNLSSMPALHLPSQLSHCGADLGMGHFNDFGWTQSTFAASHYATAV